MRNHETEIILLGLETYGYTRAEMADMIQCSPGTLIRVIQTAKGSPSIRQALVLVADRLAAKGQLIRQVGERMLAIIPAEILDESERRSGYIRVEGPGVLAEVENGTP